MWGIGPGSSTCVDLQVSGSGETRQSVQGSSTRLWETLGPPHVAGGDAPDSGPAAHVCGDRGETRLPLFADSVPFAPDLGGAAPGTGGRHGAGPPRRPGPRVRAERKKKRSQTRSVGPTSTKGSGTTWTQASGRIRDCGEPTYSAASKLSSLRPVAEGGTTMDRPFPLTGNQGFQIFTYPRPCPDPQWTCVRLAQTNTKGPPYSPETQHPSPLTPTGRRWGGPSDCTSGPDGSGNKPGSCTSHGELRGFCPLMRDTTGPCPPFLPHALLKRQR